MGNCSLCHVGPTPQSRALCWMQSEAAFVSAASGSQPWLSPGVLMCWLMGRRTRRKRRGVGGGGVVKPRIYTQPRKLQLCPDLLCGFV